jgi:chemotaxis family two-component system sensor kinase Cph1
LSAVLQDFAEQIADARGTVSAAPLPVVMCDAAQIRQVLQNLISNAVKYRHANRPLVVTIRAEQRPAEANARLADLPTLVLQVEDNGIGFDERHREQIFKPFERLHSAEDYAGSGLGLAICRQVVDRHGGSITASSRPGEGSVFTVILPLRPLSTHGPQSK